MQGKLDREQYNLKIDGIDIKRGGVEITVTIDKEYNSDDFIK